MTRLHPTEVTGTKRYAHEWYVGNRYHRHRHQIVSRAQKVLVQQQLKAKNAVPRRCGDRRMPAAGNFLVGHD